MTGHIFRLELQNKYQGRVNVALMTRIAIDMKFLRGKPFRSHSVIQSDISFQRSRIYKWIASEYGVGAKN